MHRAPKLSQEPSGCALTCPCRKVFAPLMDEVIHNSASLLFLVSSFCLTIYTLWVRLSMLGLANEMSGASEIRQRTQEGKLYTLYTTPGGNHLDFNVFHAVMRDTQNGVGYTLNVMNAEPQLLCLSRIFARVTSVTWAYYLSVSVR